MTALQTLPVAAALALAAPTAVAVERKYDPRALAECATRANEPKDECAASVHVGLAVLAGIERIYGGDAAPLLARCREINKPRADGAAECARQFIKDAAEIKARQPDYPITHPLALKLSDPRKFAALQDVMHESLSQIGFPGTSTRFKFFDR